MSYDGRQQPHTHLVVLQEGPELLQTIEVAIVVVLQCLLLKVLEDIFTELLLQAIAIEPEEALQAIPGQGTQ